MGVAEKVNILQVYPYFYPAWSYGGVTRVAYEISRRLADRGHEVTVYATDALDNKSRLKINLNPTYIDGMEIYYFKNLSNYLTYKYHIPLPLAMPFRIKEEVKKFDIIHLHGYTHSLNVLMHYYAKKYGIPYIVQTHGGVHAIFQKDGLHKFFSLLFGYRILKDASKVIALTKTEAEQYKKMGVNDDKIEIVPNGIDLSEYENLPKRGEFRRKYSIRDDEKVVLYIGRLHKSKGIDLLVKSFTDISKELDNVRLVLVGPDDGYLSALETVIQTLKVDDKVLLTGFVSSDEKKMAFVDANVFVTPWFSGFPVTFLESCACGTPIITTNNGDELDWIHDKIGYVVEYDKNQLRDAIIKILSDERLRIRFGEEGRKSVREKFGWDGIVRKVEDIYKAERGTLK